MHLLSIEEREFVFPYVCVFWVWRWGGAYLENIHRRFSLRKTIFQGRRFCIFIFFVLEYSCKHISAFACWRCEPFWRMSNIARCIFSAQKHFLERSFSQMQRDKGLHRIVLVLCSPLAPCGHRCAERWYRHCRRKLSLSILKRYVQCACRCWLREYSFLAVKVSWHLR